MQCAHSAVPWCGAEPGDRTPEDDPHGARALQLAHVLDSTGESWRVLDAARAAPHVGAHLERTGVLTCERHRAPRLEAGERACVL